METIKSSGEIDSLFAHGTRASNARVAVLASPTIPERGPNGRVVVIAGKRIGPAVLRNRARRVLRESVRRLGGPWEGYDVALIARTRTASESPAALDQAVRDSLLRVGITSC
ncbi:MAG: ribonuclease P protein component [Armatimonadota bacterium]